MRRAVKLLLLEKESARQLWATLSPLSATLRAGIALDVMKETRIFVKMVQSSAFTSTGLLAHILLRQQLMLSLIHI